MPVDILLLLVAAAFVAGYIDAVAGGGGLITIPALLLSGMDPLTVLGTNKVQGMFGSGSATLAYAAKGHVDLKSQWPAALASGVGAAGGALLAFVVPTQILETLLPFLLVAVAIFFAVRPGLGDLDRERRVSPAFFVGFAVPLIGAYDGLFGPGTGSFFMIAFVTLAGYGVLKATAHTKLLNFSSNIGSLIVFVFGGAVMWSVGLSMGVAQFLGARLGAATAMRFGSRLIRPLLVVTCLALAAKLLIG
ncbi:TSUP family transporter [Fulvimarina sp. 2208YS6-2-32]|uniref:Probable membrane transporter protein n=1 Tax=Fulvimarina uroteuthidis TaxID=3098149 RepID=A0ABU5HZC4_9HYPH|nr:TSUP family transporter [Fulvimarina sp. 2208YS6-2-32]MDY8108207.1 TSUP family transporter [Fulvimarina sp. 2208YS6-2-32]